MDLPPPAGYVFYGGADGFDGFPDAEGSIWFADNIYKPQDRSGTFTFALMRYRNGVTERIPINETIKGAGRLNWNPAGLFLCVSQQDTPESPVKSKYYQIPEFVNFNLGGSSGHIHTSIAVPPARWIADPNNLWDTTNAQLIRDKFRLTDTLLNALRDVLIKNKLAH